MKFVKDPDGDLVNIARASYIFLNDKGIDYPLRFQIMAKIENLDYVLKEYRTEGCAKGFLRRLYDKAKIEVQE